MKQNNDGTFTVVSFYTKEELKQKVTELKQVPKLDCCKGRIEAMIEAYEYELSLCEPPAGYTQRIDVDLREGEKVKWIVYDESKCNTEEFEKLLNTTSEQLALRNMQQAEESFQLAQDNLLDVLNTSGEDKPFSYTLAFKNKQEAVALLYRLSINEFRVKDALQPFNTIKDGAYKGFPYHYPVQTCIIN